MTPLELSNPVNCEISPRFILAMARVDGISSGAEPRAMYPTWQNVETLEFTYTRNSAWRIVDTILERSPTILRHVQDELDRICTALPKQPSKPEGILQRLKNLLGFAFLDFKFFNFKVLMGTSRDVSS